MILLKIFDPSANAKISHEVFIALIKNVKQKN